MKNLSFFELLNENITNMMYFDQNNRDRIITKSNEYTCTVDLNQCWRMIEFTYFWCKRCVRKLRTDFTHVCVIFEINKRTQCELCNKNAHYCEKNIVVSKFQKNVRCFVIKNNNQENLKSILKIWKSNSIQFFMRSVTNTLQMNFARIRCFLWRRCLAKQSLRLNFSKKLLFWTIRFFRLFLFCFVRELAWLLLLFRFRFRLISFRSFRFRLFLRHLRSFRLMSFRLLFLLFLCRFRAYKRRQIIVSYRVNSVLIDRDSN